MSVSGPHLQVCAWCKTDSELQRGIWGVVCNSLIDGSLCVIADEEGVVPEGIPEFFVSIGSNSEGPYLKHLCIEKCLWMGLDIIYECKDKVLGLSAACANENPVAWMNAAEYFIFGRKLFRIYFF